MNWKISHSLKWDKHEVKERELRSSALMVAPATGCRDAVRKATEQLVNQNCFIFQLIKGHRIWSDPFIIIIFGKMVLWKNVLLVLKAGVHLPWEHGLVVSEVGHFRRRGTCSLLWAEPVIWSLRLRFWPEIQFLGLLMKCLTRLNQNRVSTVSETLPRVLENDATRTVPSVASSNEYSAELCDLCNATYLLLAAFIVQQMLSGL